MTGFAHWYDAYPRKIGKIAAVKAWRKIKPSTTLAAQMADARTKPNRSAPTSRTARETDYIPNPDDLAQPRPLGR